MSEKVKRELITWVQVIVVVIFLRETVVTAYRIPTGSMINTLLIGDFLLVNRLVFGLKLPWSSITLIPGRDPKRGEIVVFRFPFENKDFVKRCIGLPGDTVEIKDKVVYVNHQRLDEPYAIHRDPRIIPGLDIPPERFQKLWVERRLIDYGNMVRDNFGPVVVPEGNFLLLGDNRDFSFDSRFWGPLPRRYLKGKPVILYFSANVPGNLPLIEQIIGHLNPANIRFGRIGKVVWNL
ncbi:signal peptidase I [candidate division WOR-3 bacterium]|uniref:Signal peptidase I n=1 Tax=candidate division WOR-3 bacterium TaxID=2052148 RepID=A0A660SJR6_UNCW3|nr:MAG: signal peptidase I [candidate division WOR-3 bacterium]